MKFVIAILAGFVAPTVIAVAAFGAEKDESRPQPRSDILIEKLGAESMKPHPGATLLDAVGDMGEQAPTKVPARK